MEEQGALCGRLRNPRIFPYVRAWFVNVGGAGRAWWHIGGYQAAWVFGMWYVCSTVDRDIVDAVRLPVPAKSGSCVIRPPVWPTLETKLEAWHQGSFMF